MASVKKNKNNPDNKGNGNGKQNKMRDSAYCEKCKDANECKRYKDYVYRMNVLFKVGHGISCDK